MEKLKGIYLIQIICALMVVNYHTQNLEIPILEKFAKGAFIVVSIFVFLSGYFLSGSYARKKYNSFWAFAKRRISRIYPAFHIMLIITLIYSLIIGKEIDLFAYLKWMTGFGYFFTENYTIYSIDHLWFVPIILVCYVLFIPSYRILQKIPYIFLTSVFALLLIYYWFVYNGSLNLYESISSDKVLQVLYHYLVFCIAIFWQQTNKNIKERNMYNISLSIIAFGVYAYFRMHPEFSVLSVISAIILVLTLVPIIYSFSSFFEKRIPIIYKLSPIPYELYLCHFLVITILSQFLQGNVIAFFLAFIISIALAFLLREMSLPYQRIFTRKKEIRSATN